MSEPETTAFTLNFKNGHAVEVGPDNATLYMFAGENSVFNHVFLDLPADDLEQGGVEISVHEIDERGFATWLMFAHDPLYTSLVAFMDEYEYPMCLNLRTVEEEDQEVYFEQVTSMADDFFNLPPGAQGTV